MMNEYILNNISKQLYKIEIAISEYLGKQYFEIVNKRLNDIDFVLVRENGVVSFENEEVYVGEEPICIKNGEKNIIAFPLNFFNKKANNIAFVHLLLHCILDDYKNIEGYNETLIDYMANDMGDILRKYKINVLSNKEPVYKSNSLYTRFYSLIEDYYIKNKNKIIKNYMSDGIKVIDHDEKLLAYEVEKEFEKFCYSPHEVKENKIIRK